MAKSYTIKSGAKINIGLRVLSRRNDGYHNIETIFHPLSIFDTVYATIIRYDSGKEQKNIVSIKTKPGLNIDNENNICFKAVNIFFDEFRIESSYRININIIKNIPLGAGLGGGSSNGATVLKILYKHFLADAQYMEHNILKLRKTALRLGSDVPYFLLYKPAYATSRGEVLSPLRLFIIKQDILIVNPGINISTGWAYNELDVHANEQNENYTMDLIRKFDPGEREKYINEFEIPVFNKYPEIENIKSKMYGYGASFSLMSGSGSTVYGLFEKKADLKSAQDYFTEKKYKTFTA